MGISQHLTTFAGLPVRQFDPDAGPGTGPGVCVWSLGEQYPPQRHGLPEQLGPFFARHGGPALTALVLGAMGNDAFRRGDRVVGIVELLLEHRDQLSNLKHLFFGDITREECEISWIHHDDLSPLLLAMPHLEELRIRGTGGLTFGGHLRHPNLKTFAIESGGLPDELLREIWAAELPKLEYLELWLGTERYGGIADTRSLEPLLSDRIFPNLHHLGLCNSDIADEVARAVAASPILSRLQELDLSKGNIGDAGARALLASPAVRTLSLLDLRHHYISDAVQAELRTLGIPVDLSDAQGEADEDDRYITATE